MADEAPVPATEAKNPWLSRGVVGGVLASIAALAMLFGVDFTAADAAHAGDLVDSFLDRAWELTGLVGGILAIWGRISANSKIKFPWQKV